MNSIYNFCRSKRKWGKENQIPFKKKINDLRHFWNDLKDIIFRRNFSVRLYKFFSTQTWASWKMFFSIVKIPILSDTLYIHTYIYIVCERSKFWQCGRFQSHLINIEKLVQITRENVNRKYLFSERLEMRIWILLTWDSI